MEPSLYINTERVEEHIGMLEKERRQIQNLQDQLRRAQSLATPGNDRSYRKMDQTLEGVERCLTELCEVLETFLQNYQYHSARTREELEEMTQRALRMFQ